jgi:hypothetical protein
MQLRCVLARVSDIALPDWLVTDPQQLAGVFSTASSGDIDLSIDATRLSGAPVINRQQVDALRLHDATAAVTGNDPAQPTKAIAVLFAGQYAYDSRHILGIMFDEGFPTPDDKSESGRLHKRPREGCAVFLDTVRAWRGGADFEAESLFTTIHELGHIFNLQHVKTPCYLAEPKTTGAFDEGYRHFTDPQKLALSHCSTSDFIRPGGKPFGQTGPYAVASHIPVGGNPHRGLELRVSSSASRFWRFEPIELDIELRVRGDAGRGFRLLDRIDPGYDEFRIWIEEPDGARRAYRSPRRYCALPGRRPLAAGEAFRRDVSVFAQAGGYTFTVAGPHRIWAEFRVAPDAWLRSPAIEIEVAAAEDTELYAAAKGALVSPAARLLYHRALRRGYPSARLERFISEHRTWSGAGRVAYGLGRALVRDGFSRAGEPGRSQHRRGTELLRRAIDAQELGEHQRDLAARILEDAGASYLDERRR